MTDIAHGEFGKERDNPALVAVDMMTDEFCNRYQRSCSNDLNLGRRFCSPQDNDTAVEDVDSDSMYTSVRDPGERKFTGQKSASK